MTPTTHEQLQVELDHLRAQIAESQSECTEQARLLSISAERELALRAQVERLQTSATFGALKAVTAEKNKLQSALELACGYLTDEQVAEVAAAMPTKVERLQGGPTDEDRRK